MRSKGHSQDQIGHLMISFAQLGKSVVRLKCGDPLMFGRAGEEIEALRVAEIDFEIVPGITAALSAAASARISLTHRNVASSVVFATAHRADDSALNWKELASSDSTIAFYMPGRHTEISRRLLQAGMSEDVPCVIVSRASSDGEHIHQTTLGALIHLQTLSAPSILLMGKALFPCTLPEGSFEFFDSSASPFGVAPEDIPDSATDSHQL